MPFIVTWQWVTKTIHTFCAAEGPETHLHFLEQGLDGPSSLSLTSPKLKLHREVQQAGKRSWQRAVFLSASLFHACAANKKAANEVDHLVRRGVQPKFPACSHCRTAWAKSKPTSSRRSKQLPRFGFITVLSSTSSSNNNNGRPVTFCFFPPRSLPRFLALPVLTVWFLCGCVFAGTATCAASTTTHVVSSTANVVSTAAHVVCTAAHVVCSANQSRPHHARSRRTEPLGMLRQWVPVPQSVLVTL